ncbi:MAG TPA: SpoIID/LytB domain-containing protein [Actinomycetota bacterium]|nr:SpoIID/LytB domain-containing protein [Actinomycetota bacterium]
MIRRALVCLLVAGAAADAVPVLAAARPASRDRVRFEAAPGQTLLVDGTYPPASSSSCLGQPAQPLLHERYRGAVEVRRASDGSMYLIGELSFQDYLKGIAEVPRDWPMEALRAQVVAARSYALSQLDPGGEYDLCATDACQVYIGAGIELGAWGHRWARAVDDTAGQVLVHRGEPAVTFYSSTSPGRTFDNEEVFGGEPLPYLRGVVERDDGASPLSRWEVALPYADLRRFLAADGRWGGRRVRRVSVEDGAITVHGTRRRLTLRKADLRDAVNDWAVCLDPARYPPTEPDGYRLPQPVPSRWFRATPDGRTLVLHGRGWGHGVGMVQWGAYGKAKRGLSSGDILAAYYGGLRPREHPVPATIRVLLAQGLTSVTVVPSGDASVERVREPAPPWRVTGGRRLRLRHGSVPRPVLRAAGFDARAKARVGHRLPAAVDLSSAARVRLEFLRGDVVTGTTDWTPFDEGRAPVRAVVPDLAAGRYLVRAAASDGVDTVRTPARKLRVLAEAPASPSPSPTPEPPRPSPAAAPAAPRSPGTGITAAAWAAVVLAVMALVLLLLRGRRRRRLHRA